MTPEEDRELRYLRHWLKQAEDSLKVFLRNHGHGGTIPDREREAAFRDGARVLARRDADEWSLNPPTA